METPKHCLKYSTRKPEARKSIRAGWWLTAVVFATGWLAAAQKPTPAAKQPASQDGALRLARQRVLAARPLGMYYYYDDARAFETLAAHASQVTLLAPQSFWVDGDGFVHGAAPEKVMEIARREKLPVMPLVINPGFDRPTASAMLRNPKAQERAVTYLAYLAKRDGYVGWQLDLEYIDPADKKLYTRFVQRAATRLHRDGRLLSVAVVPRFSDAFPGASQSGEFRTGEWGAPYDYAAIGRIVDFMTVMTYNHYHSSGPPGPVAGYAWVKEALDYAVQRVPRQKLLLGIPFYSREWTNNEQGVSSRSLAFKEVAELLNQAENGKQWDEKWKTPWLELREGTALRTVWYEDSRSLDEKLKLMRRYRLRGFAAWRLGMEDPRFWSLAAVTGRTQVSGPAPTSRGGSSRAPGRQSR